MADLLAKAEAADQGRRSRRDVDPGGAGAARGTPGDIAAGQGDDRGTRQGALEREQAEHRAKLAARAAKRSHRQEARRQAAAAAGGRPLPTDQVNLTDEESRIMPVAGGGFEQCYNAQAVVATGSLLVVATDVVQAANDKRSLSRCSRRSRLCRRNWARPKRYSRQRLFQRGQCRGLRGGGIEPLIATGRQPHHPSLDERFAEAPPRRTIRRRSRRWRIG